MFKLSKDNNSTFSFIIKEFAKAKTSNSFSSKKLA
jgi:hypothetical protein